MLGSYEKSILDYDRAIELNLEDGELYTNRGAVKLQIKDHRGAIGDFSQALHLNPADGKALYNRGMAYLQIHDSANAMHDFAMAYKNGVVAAKEMLISLQN